MLNSRIFWKIYLNFILSIILTGLVIGTFVTYKIEKDELLETEQQLTAYANLFSDLPPDELREFSPLLQERVRDVHNKLGVRITIIRSDGIVAADSDEDFSKMENHGDRPEIVQAQAQGTGVATRFSHTLQKNMMYVALPITSQGELIGFSRASFSLSDVYLRFAQFRSIGIAAIGIGALFALLFGFFLARQIVSPLNQMNEFANSMANGDFEKRVPVGGRNEFGTLASALNSMAARITEDISRRKCAEAELQNAHDELEVRVSNRTLELSQINDLLGEQIAEREFAEKTVRTSEERFRSIVETTKDWIWEIDLDGRAIYNNPAIEAILGYTPEELCGKSLWSLVREKDRAESASLLAQFIAKKTGWTNLIRHWRHKDGSLRYLESSAVPIFSDGGEVVGFRGIDHDITRRKHSEISLRRSEANLAAAQKITHLGSWEIELSDLKKINNNKIVWSDEVYRIFGYKPGEFNVSFKNFFDAVHPDDRKQVRRAFLESVSYRKKLNIQYRVVLPNGEERFQHGRGEVFYDEQSDQPVKFVGTVQDISERKLTEEKLRESQEWMKTILDGSRDGIIIEDNSDIVYVNDSYSKLLGYDAPEELIGKNISDILSPAEAKRLSEYGRQRLLGKEVPTVYEFKGRRKNGTFVDVEGAVSTSVVVGKKYIMTAIRDIADKKQTREELQKNISLLSSTFEATADGILVVDLNNEVIAFNKKYIEMWQITDEIINLKDNKKAINYVLAQIENADEYVKTMNYLILNPQLKNYDVIKFKDGKIFERHSQPQISNGEVVGRVLSFRDITEYKRAEEKLLHDAFHDGLTGLANRSLFMEHLQMTIERGKRNRENLYAVLFLDIDYFKVINDSLGHTEGDKLLKQIAQRLQKSLRPGDLVARLGGDEFTILLTKLEDENSAPQVAERIQTDLKLPFDLSGREVFTSVSIGIAFGTSAEDKQAEEMLRDADIAMYRAKAKGKARYQVFDRTMHEHAITRLRLETELRQALERQEFRVNYQPIIDIETNSLMGFESLIRWQHPERGMIPPFEFISVAEENNLIIPIGSWVLRESCRQLREWQDDYPGVSDLTVSVNLSCKEFLQVDLAEQIAETLELTKLAPHCLKLEITESHVMENSETAVKSMNRLRALGVQISLDDFGTGYSSLSYLHRLPVNFLKIDRSFVMRIADSNENEEIVRTIIKLAQSLKMKVIAEGIETAGQLTQLRQMECEYGQGYFISKPVEAESAKLFIERRAENLAPTTEQTIIDLDMNM